MERKTEKTEKVTNILLFLKVRLKHKGITHYRLAEMLDVDKATLSRYFKQKIPIPLHVYIDICIILDMKHNLTSTDDGIDVISSF
ncbi:helix-turn-helix domain-containing protein [Tenacibaculum piscium]|uniref:helix-turn-helix domain-containing protein n=1 Tax=Tenacibaculum piscium TaxID=1458515 RepID=UPI001F3F38E2|nr:helix-turn-helix transcriptional regulator [Tenacibaculum piscium]